MESNTLLFKRMAEAINKVVAIDWLNYDLQSVVNRGRFDDDVGADRLEDVATMLRTNPEFAVWYANLQTRVSEATDLEEKRQLELQLLYPFKYFQNTVSGKVKAMRTGQESTMSDHAMTKGVETDGHTPTYDELGSGNLFDKYVNAEDQAGSMRRRREVGRDTAFKFTNQSVGPMDDGQINKRTGSVMLHEDERNPAEGLMTSNLLKKVLRELESDRRSTIIFLTQLAKWNILLPTYLPRAQVPKLWYDIQKQIRKMGGRINATKDLRKFLVHFDIKDYRFERSPEIKVIQRVLMKVAGAKTARSLAEVLASPMNRSSGHEKGGAFEKPSYQTDDPGRSISEAYTQLVKLDGLLASPAINESTIESLNESFQVAARKFTQMLLNPTGRSELH